MKSLRNYIPSGLFLQLLLCHANAQNQNKPKPPCIDMGAGGIIRQEQELWDNDRFQFTCRNGSVTVTGCLSSKNGDYKLIPRNQTIEVRGFKFSCTEENGFLKYSEEPRCLVNGKELHVGEHFRHGIFNATCQPWGFGIVGCYYKNKQGEWKSISVNQTIEENGLRHFCRNRGGGTYSAGSEPMGCYMNGQVHSVNQEWNNNQFRYKCEPGQKVELIGCVRVSDAQLVPLGHNLTANGIISFCHKFGNSISFEERACNKNIDRNC